MYKSLFLQSRVPQRTHLREGSPWVISMNLLLTDVACRWQQHPQPQFCNVQARVRKLYIVRLIHLHLTEGLAQLILCQLIGLGSQPSKDCQDLGALHSL